MIIHSTCAHSDTEPKKSLVLERLNIFKPTLDPPTYTAHTPDGRVPKM